MFYHQLTQAQRYQISALRSLGHTYDEIAQVVKVHKSTISREIARNVSYRGYRPLSAHARTLKRRRKPVYRIPASLWLQVETLLRQEWSPEQISGRLKREQKVRISHEWIYQYVFKDKHDGGDLYKHLRALPALEQTLTGPVDLEVSFNRSVHQFHAEYFQPFQAHASIGPSCAVADVKEDEVTVWASSSGPYPLRGALAQLLDMPDEKIHLIHVEGAGSYGQNGSDDVAADAVILSQAVGKPVRVQWSREEEFISARSRHPMKIKMKTGVKRDGTITANEMYALSDTGAYGCHALTVTGSGSIWQYTADFKLQE